MATRAGFLPATFESTPAVLAVVSEILTECNATDRQQLSNEFVAELQARVEHLAWAPPQDQRQRLLEIAVSTVLALTIVEAN